jgi:hypothetical protein
VEEIDIKLRKMDPKMTLHEEHKKLEWINGLGGAYASFAGRMTEA